MSALIRYTYCFLLLIGIFIAGWYSQAYAKSEVEIYLGEVITTANSNIEIIANIKSDKQLNGYDIEINFDQALTLLSYDAANSCNGNIQVAQTSKNTVTLLCLLPPTDSFTGNDSVNLVFNSAESSSSVSFTVGKADLVDESGIFTRDLKVEIRPFDEGLEIPASGKHDFSTTVLVIAGIIVLVAAANYLYRNLKQKSPIQIRMFDFIGILSLTFAITATVLVVSTDNLDITEKAAQQSSVTAESSERKSYSAGLKEDWQRCQSDSDCVTVSESCCPCSGSNLSINRKYLGQFNRQYRCDGNIACITVDCESPLPYCLDNLCALAQDLSTKCRDGGQDPDLNSDGRVSITDYNVFLTRYLDFRFSGKFDAIADLNCDSDLSLKDYTVFVVGYLKLNSR